MTSKERIMLALHREKPDRLPVTIHQWQPYHLDKYMGGVDALTAFKQVGLDASITYFELIGQFWIPDTAALATSMVAVEAPGWRDEITVVSADPDNRIAHHTVHTPEGTLTYRTGGDRTTTWITEYMIKRHEDLDLIEKYMPVPKLDKARVAAAYDQVGDAGILRGFVWGDQGGCWQHACCLMDAQDLILEAFDNPDWVHRLMRVLLDKKLRFIEESLVGAKYDLIETGGGAASDTLISPELHRTFCLPYDRQIHGALRAAGHLSVYHTCGGMMRILDCIRANGCDASETLAPPGVGGNIKDPAKVREAFGGRLAMVGGLDQFHVLTDGTPEQIRAEVHRLFEGFGPDGGYICSASDHFFETPPENLRALAEAGRECVY
ncbi:MAG TPA: uroporphyrinogen decarboxylase family protein [Phycisphaerae bacterium]|nr:uroporphyrinogen decarboxylase family protein [Phycisphaerae bacterium]